MANFNLATRPTNRFRLKLNKNKKTLNEVHIMKNIKSIIITLLATVFIAQSSYAAGVSFYHADPSGTPIRMTDETGKVSWLIIYNPFGEQGSLAKMGHNQKRFIGKELDSETGLLNVGVRYMKNGIGRFTSPDPVGPVDPMTSRINMDIISNPQRINAYTYGLNNPYKFIDSDGRKVKFSQGSSKLLKDETKRAIQYLNNGKSSKVIADLEKLPQTVYIKETNVPIETSWDMNTNTILWDPLGALECTNGSKQTPALGLLHEAAHALGDLTGTSIMPYVEIKGDPYGYAEERRVIKYYETPAAIRLGEGTRKDHGGKSLYHVPTSISK